MYGLVRMTQLVLPAMRRQRWGRIVSDALRFEVREFGIDVVVIEPGLIRTRFGETAVSSITDVAAAEGPYADFNRAMVAATAGAYDGPLGRLGAGPEAVAARIEQAISAKRPRTRYPVTPSARLLIGQRRLLPDRLWDAFLRTSFQPGAKNH